MSEDDAKTAILMNTAFKFFPGWEITSGLKPDPWVKVSNGVHMLEVHIPRGISLEDMEQEVYAQLKRVQTEVTMEDSPFA